MIFPVLLNIADAALYTVKNSGRDGWGCIEAGTPGNGELFEMPSPAAPIAQQLKDKVSSGHLQWKASRAGLNLINEQNITDIRARQ